MILGDELLRGEKITLTKLNREDLQKFPEWFAAEFSTLRMLHDAAYPLTAQDEEAFYEQLSQDHSHYTFAIRVPADNQVIGTCSLFGIEWAARRAELGILIADPEAQGRGFGTDAVRVLVRYGFMELNLNRIYLRVYSYNLRGLRAYEKVGFVKEGLYRQAILRDGQAFDIIPMSILRREWEAQNPIEG